MIIGHTDILELLERFREKGSDQAYLFTGPDAVGKFLTALRWGLGLAGASEQAFARLEAGEEAFPEIFVVAPEEETKRGVTREKDIPIKAILPLKRFLSFASPSGGKRVAIVRSAHRLTEKAQNALLKTLEEPPRDSVIILVTHLPGRLPETILSRVHTLTFGRVGEQELAERFGDVPGAEALIPLGQPGLLVRLRRDARALHDERHALAELTDLPTRLGDRLDLAERLSKNLPLAERVLVWWAVVLEREARRSADYGAERGKLLRADAATQAAAALAREPGSGRIILDNMLIRA